MTSTQPQRLGKASGPSRRLLTLLVGLLLGVVTIMSGAPNAAAQNGVGPQPQNLILVVGTQATAGQNSTGLQSPPLRQHVSATGVAGETGVGAARTGSAELDSLAATGQRSVGETTKVAQELQKHQGGLFPVVTRGVNPNTEGQKILNEILYNSSTARSSVTSGNFKGGTRFIDPSGRGATFDSTGTFQYFGEYP